MPWGTHTDDRAREVIQEHSTAGHRDDERQRGDAVTATFGTAPFGQRLADAVAARGPLCVGIDPHPPLLEKWGLYDDADGLARFTDAVVDALAGSVAVLEGAVPRARAAGALVLLDAKRGDIGSTMDAYGDYLRPDHPLAVDAMTVSPYLGPGSLQPAVDTAR